jgi:hypothetical protein
MLPILKYRMLRSDMIEIYNIIAGKDDNAVAPSELSTSKFTRGNCYTMATQRTHYIYIYRLWSYSSTNENRL